MKTEEQESAKILEIIFENTHTMIAYLDRNLDFIRVNKSYAAANSKDPEYFTGKNHFDLFPNEENEYIFRNAVKTGEPYFAYAKAFEYEYNPEIGVTHWDWSLVPVKDETGVVTSLILHLINVTERIKAEEELQIEKNFNATILDAANALVVVLDKKGKILRFNPACEKITGYSFNEIKNSFIWDKLLLADEIDSVKNVFHNISEHGSSGDYINDWVSRDGSKRKIHWNNSVFAPDDKVQYVISIGIDITEQEKIREKLQRSEETMKKAQESAHIGSWEWDINKNTLFWSDEVYRIFGVDSQSFQSTYQHFKEFIHPDELQLVEQEVEKSLNNKNHSYSVEHKVIRPDGETRYVVESGKVYFESDQPVRMIGIVQDITEKKIAESALRKNRNILDLFMDTVSEGMTILDKNLNILEINREASNIFKKDRIELIGKNILDLAPASRNTERFQQYMKVMETGIPYQIEDAQITPSPNEFYMSVKAFKVGDGLGIVTTDTTSRVKAKKALEDEFEFNQLILETVPTGIAIYEESGQCIAANTAVAEKIGGTPNQLLQQNFHEIQSWKDCGLYDVVLKCIEENNKLSVYDFDIKTSFGKEISIECQIVPFIRKNKKHVLMTLDDITERKQTVQALQESENRYQLAVNGSNDGIWDWNIITGDDYFSPRFRSLLGYRETDEFPQILDSFINRIHPEDKERVNNAIKRHLNNNEPYNIELRLRKKDNSYIWFMSRGQAIWDANGNPVRMAGSVTDITQTKNNEAEITKYKNHLEELVQERTVELKNTQDELVRKGRLATLGQLTATVSHELRNPLAAMRPSLYFLEKTLVTENDKIITSLERIKRGIDRCDHIIDELLDFTRETHLEKSNIVIDDWLHKLFEEIPIPNGVVLTKHFTIGGHAAKFDPNRMRRAVINAFENGCQSMLDSSNNKIAGSGRITVSSRLINSKVEIEITDTGTGIADHILPKIFEPLFSTKGFGVGLGMSAIKQILEQHEGGIEIKTKVKEGTSVTLWFPRE